MRGKVLIGKYWDFGNRNECVLVDCSKFLYLLLIEWASLVAQVVKNSPAVQEIWVQSLGWEDLLEKGAATHFTILACRIPWTEGPGWLQHSGPQRIGHNWAIFACSLSWLFFFFLPLINTEKAMAPHSSTLAWKIPWMKEPGRLQSLGSRGVGHDCRTSLSLFPFLHWRRKWQPTPVFLPGESQRRGSLVGSRLRGRTESDTTEAT